MLYARVHDGEVLEIRGLSEPPPSPDKLALGKPRFLSYAVLRPTFDPVSEALDGPEREIGNVDVVDRYTKRPKSDDELAAMRAEKVDAIEAEFQRLCALPIAFEVGGELYEWHADAEAVTNIVGVVTMITAGVPVPNPREWTPLGSMRPVEITHVELIGLGAAIAMRKDALFTIKKVRQASVLAMTDAHEIAAVDAAEGWG